MSEQCRKQFDSIVNVIDTIDHLYNLKNVRVQVNKWVEKCNPPEIYKIFLEFKIWNLEKSLQ